MAATSAKTFLNHFLNYLDSTIRKKDKIMNPNNQRKCKKCYLARFPSID